MSVKFEHLCHEDGTLEPLVTFLYNNWEETTVHGGITACIVNNDLEIAVLCRGIAECVDDEIFPFFRKFIIVFNPDLEIPTWEQLAGKICITTHGSFLKVVRQNLRSHDVKWATIVLWHGCNNYSIDAITTTDHVYRWAKSRPGASRTQSTITSVKVYTVSQYKQSLFDKFPFAGNSLGGSFASIDQERTVLVPMETLEPSLVELHQRYLHTRAQAFEAIKNGQDFAHHADRVAIWAPHQIIAAFLPTVGKDSCASAALETEMNDNMETLLFQSSQGPDKDCVAIHMASNTSLLPPVSNLGHVYIYPYKNGWIHDPEARQAVWQANMLISQCEVGYMLSLRSTTEALPSVRLFDPQVQLPRDFASPAFHAQLPALLMRLYNYHRYLTGERSTIQIQWPYNDSVIQEQSVRLVNQGLLSRVATPVNNDHVPYKLSDTLGQSVYKVIFSHGIVDVAAAHLVYLAQDRMTQDGEHCARQANALLRIAAIVTRPHGQEFNLFAGFQFPNCVEIDQDPHLKSYLESEMFGVPRGMLDRGTVWLALGIWNAFDRLADTYTGQPLEFYAACHGKVVLQGWARDTLRENLALLYKAMDQDQPEELPLLNEEDCAWLETMMARVWAHQQAWLPVGVNDVAWGYDAETGIQLSQSEQIVINENVLWNSERRGVLDCIYTALEATESNGDKIYVPHYLTYIPAQVARKVREAAQERMTVT